MSGENIDRYTTTYLQAAMDSLHFIFNTSLLQKMFRFCVQIVLEGVTPPATLVIKSASFSCEP
jgi:hypothetical protein